MSRRIQEAAYVLEAVKNLHRAEQALEKRSNAEGASQLCELTQSRIASLRNATATAAEDRDRCRHEVIVRQIEVGYLPASTEIEATTTARRAGCDWQQFRRTPDAGQFARWCTALSPAPGAPA